MTDAEITPRCPNCNSFNTHSRGPNTDEFYCGACNKYFVPQDCGYLPGEGSAYNYIPKWMIVPKLYETEDQGKERLAVIKLFDPAGSWTWYISEYDGDDTCFGLVDGFEKELGYFSLSELKDVKCKFGLRIERDKWFKPTPLSEL